MILTQKIGDTKTYSIPLSWNGRPFVPENAWTLLFTVKALASQADSLRLFQKAFPGQGITLTGKTASVEVLRADTFRTSPDFEAAPGDYLWDIQAYEIALPNRTRTVAEGTFTLKRDITRLSGPTGPLFVVEDPALLVVGETGPAGTITAVTVATGSAGSSASVTLGGTPSARTIALTIPRGDVGTVGATGPAGSGISNIDGGSPDSNYTGIPAIDAGDP